MASWSDLPLSPEHAAILRASAISPDVAYERAYRTVIAEQVRAHFHQHARDGLLIPMYGLTGRKPVTVQLRPDEPRTTKDDKAIKYETPSGAALHADIHPRIRPVVLDPTRPLVITEGIRKTDAGISAGLAVIGLTGVTCWRPKGKVVPELVGITWSGRSVRICFDSDASTNPDVLRAERELAAWLTSQGATVRAIRLPAGSFGAKVGLDDWLADGHQVAELDGLTVTPGKERRKLTCSPLGGLEFTATEWLWTGRVPLGAFSLLIGSEGIGKSTIAYWMAARVTRGELPGERSAIPANVGILATEDSYEQTIGPRLSAAGADMSRCFRLDAEGSVSFPEDVEELTEVVQDNELALIILDPLLSRMSSTVDTYRDAEVKRALEPALKMARDTNATIIGIIHDNKSSATDPSKKIMASKAFNAAARAALFVVRDLDDPSIRYLGTTKSNQGIDLQPTLMFTLLDTLVGVDNKGREVRTGRVEWRGETTRTISDILADANRDPDVRSQTDDAAQWLVEFLTAYPDTSAPSQTVKDAGRLEGYGESMLKKALSRAGVTVRREGFPSVTHWTLSPSSASQTTVGTSPRAGGFLTGPTGPTGEKAILRNPVEITVGPLGPVRETPPRDAREPLGEDSAPLFFDLETAPADQLFRRADFVRLGAFGETLTTSGDEVAEAVRRAPLSVGHNICAFDLVALAKWHGLNLVELRDKIFDTDLAARLADPPPSGKEGVSTRPRGYFSLDETAKRLGVPGKSADLKALAKLHGGFDKIPTDDPTYRAYLAGDVSATRAVFNALPPLDDYARREMNVGLITAQMTVNGWRVDVPELRRALDDQVERKAENLAELAHRTGLPLTRTKVYKTKPDVVEEIASPLASDAGKAAVIKRLRELGVHPQHLPKTAKSREVSLSGDGLKALREKIVSRGLEDRFGEALRIIELVISLVAERTVYQTIESCRFDDRVHPSIRPTQASGRWSVTGPGLTVFGKRGGRHVERRVLLPEVGHAHIAIDLDQVDARGVAAHCQDPDYMGIFQAGIDLHSEVATQVYGSAKGEFRELAKIIGHGWNYGRGVKALAMSGVPIEAAKTFDREMRRKYPRLVEWQAEVRALGESGELLDNGWGRKLRCDPRFAYTQAPALVGQGCTRDILAEGMLRLPVEFWPFLRVIVHDELVLSVPVKDAEEIGREVVRAMTFEFRGVPITAGVSKPGRNWAEVYEK